MPNSATVTNGGKTLRPGQQECDRPRELKAQEGWIVVGSDNWKERLSNHDGLKSGPISTAPNEEVFLVFENGRQTALPVNPHDVENHGAVAWVEPLIRERTK